LWGEEKQSFQRDRQQTEQFIKVEAHTVAHEHLGWLEEWNKNNKESNNINQLTVEELTYGLATEIKVICPKCKLGKKNSHRTEEVEVKQWNNEWFV
jgi:hypothetical protein